MNALVSQENYVPLGEVTAIVCDTQYVTCAGDSRDCSDSGGMNSVMSGIDIKEGSSWSQLNLFLFAALGSNAITAAQTVFGGLGPANATVRSLLD